MAARWVGGFVLAMLLPLVSMADSEDKAKEQPSDESAEAVNGPVQPVINVGGHSGAIRQMVFGNTGKRLYTVGLPGEVHEWDAETGERLRVWRFPLRATRITLSPDGKLLAVGSDGAPSEKAGMVRSQVWLIDRSTGRMRLLTEVQARFVQRLAFSPSGDRLAINAGETTRLLPLAGKGSALELPNCGHLYSLRFDPSGNRLLTARQDATDGPQLRIYDTNSGSQRRIFPQANGRIPMAAFSPNGKRVASITGGKKPHVCVWTLGAKTGKPDWRIDHEQLLDLIGAEEKEGEFWTSIGVAFRSQNEAVACWEKDRWVRIVLLDVANKKARLLRERISRHSLEPGGMALSRDGQLLAFSANPNYKLLIYDLEKGKSRTYPNPLARGKSTRFFGPIIARPGIVGWTEKGDGIVWGRFITTRGKRPELIDQGLNFGNLKRLPREECVEVDRASLPEGWKLEVSSPQEAILTRGGQKTSIALIQVRPQLARSFKDRTGKLRLLVPYALGRRLAIVDPETGKQIGKVGHIFSPLYDVAVSPDDRYLLVAGGGQDLAIFDLAKPAIPLLQILSRRQDWIAWTQEGYYAGTPGGWDLMGWLVIGKPDQPPAFYLARSFGKKLYRPDVISRLLKAGSVEAALKQSETKSPGTSVEELLPPTVRITKVMQEDTDKRRFIIEAFAESSAANQPIETLELRANGRRLPDEQGIENLGKGKKSHTVRWSVSQLPSGKVELKVLALCPDVTGVSAALEVKVPEDPKATKNLPSLHVISIGINYEDNANLKLDCPRNDASAIAKAFRDACIGPKNLFGNASPPEVLLDKQATAQQVKDALTRVRRLVKPQDLLVLFYAGHGVREKGEFFLLTHGANLKDLKNTALSGTELRKKLADFPCQVLLVLDACHSGQAAQALRGLESATDDASRQLADEECAVTLLAAALGHEKALERKGAKNGLFTDALLRVLGRAKEASHNRRDGRQYVHHLFADVLDEVQYESKDRQHPFLSLPVTIESFPVRRVDVNRETSR